MKSAAAESEYVLASHWAKEKGIPNQSIRDAIARRELDVLWIGRENSKRRHAYITRVGGAAWLEQQTTKRKKPNALVSVA